MTDYIVLIPAYKPDEKLIKLVQDLKEREIRMHIVDDGSGDDFTPIFEAVEQEGATVHRYPVNKGKGGALKTGIADILQLEKQPLGIVTADADGQHTPEDISRIINEMKQRPNTLIIGGRKFVGDVPLRSKVGNGITRFVYFISTGNRIHDTQTGLRGLPAVMYEDLLTIKGDRYEYEMDMLLKIKSFGVSFYEMPIETVYINGNETSHFHVLRDSWRIYKQILSFCASALISTGLDYLLYMLLPLLGILNVSMRYVIARVFSATANYLLNRHIVFKTGSKTSVLKYIALALVVMGIGAAGVRLFESIGIPSFWSKVMTDVPLFVVNYVLQRKVVFKPNKK